MKRKTSLSGAAAGRTLIIAAGGTGGHITPGISIAEAWLAQGGRIILATLVKNFDYLDIVRLSRNEEVTLVAYDAPRLVKNPLKLFAFLKRFFASVRLIKQAAKAENAVAVLGMGGYSSFPAVFLAITQKLPLFLCEQNAHWGMVTRIGRFFARAVFLSFRHSRNLPKKFIVTGNPLRAMFGDPKPKARKTNPGTKEILFLGGSQGASDINALYLKFTASPAAKKYHCTVAAGGSGFDDLRQRARKSDTVLPFIEDMASAYLKSDFIVARCGSGTLFEILWSEKPSFLIPYPFAAADHQRANAEAMQREMACVIFDKRPFAAEDAHNAFTSFLLNPPPAKAVKTRPRAESEIARYIVEALNHA